MDAYILVLLSVTRFLAIVYPLRSRSVLITSNICIAVGIMGIAFAVIATLLVTLLDVAPFKIKTSRQKEFTICIFASNTSSWTIVFIVTILSFFLPMTVMYVLYGYILFHLKQKANTPLNNTTLERRGSSFSISQYHALNRRVFAAVLSYCLIQPIVPFYNYSVVDCVTKDSS